MIKTIQKKASPNHFPQFDAWFSLTRDLFSFVPFQAFLYALQCIVVSVCIFQNKDGIMLQAQFL